MRMADGPKPTMFWQQSSIMTRPGRRLLARTNQQLSPPQDKPQTTRWPGSVWADRGDRSYRLLAGQKGERLSSRFPATPAPSLGVRFSREHGSAWLAIEVAARQLDAKRRSAAELAGDARGATEGVREVLDD